MLLKALLRNMMQTGTENSLFTLHPHEELKPARRLLIGRGNRVAGLQSSEMRYEEPVPGTVTVSAGRGDSAPAGAAAFPPGGPQTPAPVHTLRTGSVRHAHPLVAPLEHSHAPMT